MTQQSFSVRARFALIRRIISFFQDGDFSSIVDLFSRIDADKIGELFDAIRQLMATEEWTGQQGRMAAALRIAKIVAQFSETETDDQLLATLEGVLKNIGVLNAMAEQCETATAGAPVALTADVQATYEAAGFDLGRMIALINLLLELFRGES